MRKEPGTNSKQRKPKSKPAKKTSPSRKVPPVAARKPASTQKRGLGALPEAARIRLAPPTISQAAKFVLESPPLPPQPAVQTAPAATPASVREPESTPMAFVDRGQSLPDGYRLDRLIALVRDPEWLFCYWELGGPRMPRIFSERGKGFAEECAWALRIHRVNNGIADDLEIDPSVGNWYIRVAPAGKYVVELGLLSPDGEWISLLVSPMVETPRNSPSDEIDEQWRMRPEEEEALKTALRRSLASLDERATSGALGASRLLSSFALASSMTLLGSSASGRPVAGSWAFSFLGASGKVPGSGGSGGFGWLVSPSGALEPELDRPQRQGGPNWNKQPALPGGIPSKTNHPNFKVKLPQTTRGLKVPAPTWPPAEFKPRLAGSKNGARN